MKWKVSLEDLEKNRESICRAWDEDSRIEEIYLERGYPARYKSDIKEPVEIPNAKDLLRYVYTQCINYVPRPGKILPVITEIGLIKGEDDLFVSESSVAMKEKILRKGGPFLELAHSYYKNEEDRDEIERDPLFRKFREFIFDYPRENVLWNPASYMYRFDLVDGVYVLNACPGPFMHHTHPIKLPPKKEDIIVEGYDLTLLHFPNDQDYKPVFEDVNIVWLPYDSAHVREAFSGGSSAKDAERIKKRVIDYHLDNVGKGEVIGMGISPDRTQKVYLPELFTLFVYEKIDPEKVRKRSPYMVDFHPLTMPK